MTTSRIDDDLEALVRQFQGSDLVEMHVRTADIELFLSRNPDADPALGGSAGAAPAPGPVAVPAASTPPNAPDTAPLAPSASAPAATPATTVPENWSVIRAPYLGTFYRAPKPGEANFVELGQTVEAGVDLCLVEVMKLFTAVCADVKGVVRHVHVRDGEMVTEGQPLFTLEPVD